jgi:2-dehydrotetronate isomerase
MKLSAHIGYQFTEAPFLERFALAARAGYRAVEFPVPYAYEVDVLKAMLQEHQLELAQISAPAGLPDKGEKGLAALSGRGADFQHSLEAAVGYAVALRCPRVHIMAGTAGGTFAADWQTYVGNMRLAVQTLSSEGIATLAEIMSPGEVPGYYLSSFELAEALFDAIPDANLQCLFDTYHAAALTKDVPGLLRHWLPRTGHIQISDFPGRHEPGTGELPFDQLYEQIDASGYDGWVGCEYRPATTTAEGLVHLRRYLYPAGRSSADGSR